jgi:hypothetical protein
LYRRRLSVAARGSPERAKQRQSNGGRSTWPNPPAHLFSKFISLYAMHFCVPSRCADSEPFAIIQPNQ